MKQRFKQTRKIQLTLNTCKVFMKIFRELLIMSLIEIERKKRDPI